MTISRRRLVGTSLSAIAGCALMPTATWAQSATPQSASAADWPQFRGGPSRTAATSTPGPTGNLAPLWVYASDAKYLSNPIVAEDSLYVLGSEDILFAIDRVTGAQRWAVPLGGDYSDGYHTVPAYADGRLYSGSATGFVFALGPDTGDELWRFATGDVIISPPLAAAGVVYTGSNDGFFYALDGESGQLRWKTDTGPIFAASPALGGDAVFVGAADGTLFCLDSGSGAKRWSFATGGAIKTSAVADGAVFVPSGDGRLYVLDATTGTQRWASPELEHPNTVNNPSVLGDTVVVSIDNNGVFAFDVQTGTATWARTDYGDTQISSTVIAGAVVYVSVHEQTFDTLDLATGHTVASYALGRFAGAPALAAETLYIFADDGKGYAFGPAPAGVATPQPLPEAVIGTMPTTAPRSRPPVPSVPTVGTLVRTIATGSGPDDPLQAPEGIAFSADGTMYIVDALNNRIAAYTATGAFERVIGKAGASEGEFAFSTPDKLGFLGGMAVGPDGSLYVCDPFNARLQRIAVDGRPIATVGLGDGALPSAVAIDATAGRVYASDLGSGTLLVFDLDLELLMPVGPAGAPTPFQSPFQSVSMADGSLWVAEFDASALTHLGQDGQPLERIGRYGIADGRFVHALGLVTDAKGRFFASDYGSGRVQVFDATGTPIGVIGSKGSGDGQFATPTYLAFGPDGLLYVSDDTANRVLVFSVTIPA